MSNGLRSNSVVLLMRQELKRRRRAILIGAIGLGAVAVVFLSPQLLGGKVVAALDDLDEATPSWLWLAGLLFVAAIVCWSLAWRSVVHACGGEIGPVDAASRYAVGSGVNTIAPARLGDAVRIALFSSKLPNRERVWTSAGAYTTVGAARALWVGVLLVCGIAFGGAPVWPLVVAIGFVLAAVAAAVVTRRRDPTSRLAHFFDAYRQLGRSPRHAAPVVAWMGAAMLARVGAAAAVASSLGVKESVTAALLIVPALDVAGLVPLTPGNVGLTSGAVAIALQAHGLGLTDALAVGIALHAVEAIAGLVVGALGLLVLAGERRPVARHTAVALGAATAIIAVAGALDIGLLARIV
jgi:uncharacterized membrane protein YbhN (UPF0104 family)